MSRLYTTGRLVRDVSDLLPRLSDLYGIWIERRIDPAFREAIMTAVAEANGCRFCAFEHGELLSSYRSGVGPGDAGADAVSLAYARALAASELEATVAALAGEVRARSGEWVRADIELVARVMTVFNRSSNTFDAFLDRLRGNPDPESRLGDELVFAILFALVAPGAVTTLITRRRKGPLALLRQFFAFSDRFRTHPDAAAEAAAPREAA